MRFTHSYEINAGEKASLQTISQVLGCNINQSWKDFALDYGLLSSCCLGDLEASDTCVSRALVRFGIVSSIIRGSFGTARSYEEGGEECE